MWATLATLFSGTVATLLSAVLVTLLSGTVLSATLPAATFLTSFSGIADATAHGKIVPRWEQSKQR